MIKFPEHKAALILYHNDHLNNYSTVKQAIESEDFGYDCWISKEQEKKAIETNEWWMLQWYPLTPVGFLVASACDLDKLLEFCNEQKY